MSIWSKQWAAASRERPDAELSAVLMVAALTPIVANREGFWIDETITVQLIERWNLVELLTVLPTDQPHLPMWYVLVDVLGVPAGQILSWLALPATAYATYRLAHLLDGHRAGLVAAGLIAFSPYLASQASWLRMYALLTAAMTWGLWLAYESRYRGAIIAMLLGAVLHPFGVFGPAWLGYRLVRTRQATAPRLLGVFAGLIPMVAMLLLHVGPSGFTTQSTGVRHAVLPSPAKPLLTPLAVLAGTLPTHFIDLAPALVVSMFAVWWWPDTDLAVWVGTPLTGIVVGSFFLYPVYELKYFGFLAPAVAVALVTADRPQWTRSTFWTLLAVLYLAGWVKWSLGIVIAQRFFFP